MSCLTSKIILYQGKVHGFIKLNYSLWAISKYGVETPTTYEIMFNRKIVRYGNLLMYENPALSDINKQ